MGMQKFVYLIGARGNHKAIESFKHFIFFSTDDPCLLFAID